LETCVLYICIELVKVFDTCTSLLKLGALYLDLVDVPVLFIG